MLRSITEGVATRRRPPAPSCVPNRQGLADADLTFQPQLNSRSLKIAAEKEDRDLYAEAGPGRRPSSAPRSGSHSDGACTFAPAINCTSERLLEDSATVPAGGGTWCGTPLPVFTGAGALTVLGRELPACRLAALAASSWLHTHTQCWRLRHFLLRMPSA